MYPRLALHFSNYMLVSAMHWTFNKITASNIFYELLLNNFCEFGIG